MIDRGWRDICDLDSGGENAENAQHEVNIQKYRSDFEAYVSQFRLFNTDYTGKVKLPNTAGIAFKPDEIRLIEAFSKAVAFQHRFCCDVKKMLEKETADAVERACRERDLEIWDLKEEIEELEAKV